MSFGARRRRPRSTWPALVGAVVVGALALVGYRLVGGAPGPDGAPPLHNGDGSPGAEASAGRLTRNPDGGVAYGLGDGRSLWIGPARGKMPSVARTVRLTGSGERALATIDLGGLPGEVVAVAPLAGQPGLFVVEAEIREGGARLGVRYAALRVDGDRLEPVDYYARIAPEPEVKSGPYLYIDKELNHLWHFVDGRLVGTYPVATGRDRTGKQPDWDDYMVNYVTPVGRWTIDQKVVNPPYYGGVSGHPPAAGGNPDNPLGTRWMGFSVLGPEDDGSIWGIHGTNEPERLGQWASDGCIRMYTPDVERLFEQVPEGTPLRVVDRRAE